VVLDLVDAVAEAVVGAQAWRVFVGLEAPGDALGGAAGRAERGQPVAPPGAAASLYGLAQRASCPAVVVFEGRRHVLYGGLRHAPCAVVKL
jgi:hypothetical protein